MHVKLWQAAVVVMLLIPIGGLAVVYDSLPDEFPVLRGWGNRPPLLAKKSLLTVFRIPLIGILTAAAAELLRRHAAAIKENPQATAAERIWLTLFVTAGVKSLWEGVELTLARGASSLKASTWSPWVTLAIVLAGMVIAAVPLPRAWPLLRQQAYWKMSRTEKLSFVGLAILYLAAAVGPIVLARLHAN